MKTAITTKSSPNLKALFPRGFHVTIPSFKPPTVIIATARAAVALRCSKNGSPSSASGSNGDSSLKELLSGMVDERIEELLNKEENKGLLDGLERASQRVEMAKAELAEIRKQEMEAEIMRNYVNQLESRASEITECQKEISEARTMVEEAERSLGGQVSRDESRSEERLESVKAALISAVVGTLAQLPISLTRDTTIAELILPLTITFVSCALFGVTFRYAIRKDLDNFQLKSGTSAAFGFVKGLGMLGAGPPLESDVDNILSHVSNGAVYVSESLLIFLFAGVALDFCIKMRILSPFPIDPSVPKT